jgi:hypothetical protein
MFEPWLWSLLTGSLWAQGQALAGARPVALSMPGRPAHAHAMELRVDVQWDSAQVDEELNVLHARLTRAGHLGNGHAFPEGRFPELLFHHRQVDGEHHIHVEDVARGCLAGCTVFNRLVEVNRRLDRFVRAPHSRYAQAYQRRGIASAVYEWALAQGYCLVSSARQSPGAHALWRSLGTRHPLEYIELRDKCIHLLGSAVDPATQDRLQTRMVLLGKNAPGQGKTARPMPLAHNVMHRFRA